jgi:hypothetical protein
MRKYFLFFLSVTLLNCSSLPKNKPLWQDQVYSLSLQGDVKGALELLPPSTQGLSPGQIEILNGYRKRFILNSFPGVRTRDDFVNEVIDIYESYWDQVLMGKLSKDAGLEYLFRKLNEKLPGKTQRYSIEKMDALLKDLKKKLSAKGYDGIFGTTLPYADLMLWKTQIEKQYEVPLHDGVENVTVMLLDDFAVLGWSAYATLNARYTTGWAGKDKLFCVTASWDLNSEKFLVSFLAHEARHFKDYRVFPKLEGPDLEYRAKLTELSLAKDTSLALVEKFERSGEDNRKSPHAYGNFHVIKDLRQEISRDMGREFSGWDHFPVDVIRRSAKVLLDRNTQLLKKTPAN